MKHRAFEGIASSKIIAAPYKLVIDIDENKYKLKYNGEKSVKCPVELDEMFFEIKKDIVLEYIRTK